MPEGAAVREALKALGTERDLYLRILDLTVAQRREAESGRTEALLAVLADKGRLTELVTRTAELSRELKAGWPAISAGLGAAEAETGRGLLNEIAGLLRRILEEEEACQRLVGQNRDGALEDLLRVQKGRKAAQAYGSRPAGDPRFKDERK